MGKSKMVQGSSKENAKGCVAVYDNEGNLRIVNLALGNDGNLQELHQGDKNFHPHEKISEHFFATLGVSLENKHSEERDLGK